jgi:glyoxylase-like metal-dependent hydrolase (beta-lactamase superfamily II)
VDTGRHAGVQAIADFAANAKKPEAIVNTHWHLDHVGGNAVLRDRFPACGHASGALRRPNGLRHLPCQLEEMVAKTTDAAAWGFRADSD